MDRTQRPTHWTSHIGRVVSRKKLVRPARFERATLGFGGQYSIQLSYGRVSRFYPFPWRPADRRLVTPLNVRIGRLLEVADFPDFSARCQPPLGFCGGR